jgi:Hemolysin coregulated protein Hcp (TssD)
MAYEMKFNFAGAKYNVLASSFAFNRSVDAKGRPSSGVYGGELNLTIESQDDTKIVEIMLNKQTTAQTGEIEYSKGTNQGVFRKVSFEDGFITSYSEAESSGGTENMAINITISARVIKIGDSAKLENNWPDHKA